MSAAYSETVSVPVQESPIELSPAVPLGEKLRRVGKSALASAAVVLALSAVETPSSGADIHPITQVVAPNIEAPIPDLPPTPPSPLPPLIPATPSKLSVGIATGSWNDDGLGKHTLFKDVATTGMTEVRFNWLVAANFQQFLPMVQAEVSSALANNLVPVINLQQDPSVSLEEYPAQAIQMAAELPQVTQFNLILEPNSDYFGNISPAEDASILAQTTPAIHQLRSGAEVRGGNIASGFHQIDYTEKLIQIADQKYGGLANILDYLDIHEYHSLARDLATIKAVKQMYQGPIGLGEVGWIVQNGDKTTSQRYAVSPSQQAVNTVGLLAQFVEDPQIRYIDFFRLKANRADPFDTAFITADGTKRSAWYMLQSILTGQ